MRNSITPKMDAMALDFCIEMEKAEIVSVPIPTNESQWDKNTGRYRSIISLKHAAQAAGMGTIRRHSLLITPELLNETRVISEKDIACLVRKSCNAILNG